jgi:hypothetical protein
MKKLFSTDDEEPRKLKKVVVLNETEDLDVSSSRFKLNDTEAPSSLKSKGEHEMFVKEREDKERLQDL